MSLSLGVAMGINFATGLLGGLQKSNEAYQSMNNYYNQASIYRKNAYTTRLVGAMNEDALSRQNRSYLAQVVASANEAGMGESPTMMSALLSTMSVLEQNVLNARYQTESEAENYLYQARVAEENARLMRKKSRHLFKSGLINGISSALSLISPSSM